MNDNADRSCWGITAWAVGMFCVALLVSVMFGDADIGANVVAATLK